MPDQPDQYTEADLRRFLASAEERAEMWRRSYDLLLQRLRCIADALYVGDDDGPVVRDDDHLRHVIEKQLKGLPEGWNS